MANMSYCRFENTSRDMADCLEALDNEEANNLSKSEIRGLENILEYAKHIIELEDDISYAIQLSVNDEALIEFPKDEDLQWKK